jgi:maleylpyruvate isomerase
VPTLIDGDTAVTQSLAIIEYLDERHPQPPLLPPTPAARARVRGIALAIACDIHPLNNLRVLRYLKHTLGASEEAKDAWYRHWIDTGLAALEAQLAAESATGAFCHGDVPTLADICLVPQLANARRSNIPLEPYPTLVRIDARCRALEAFARATPERQPDAA